MRMRDPVMALLVALLAAAAAVPAPALAQDAEPAPGGEEPIPGEPDAPTGGILPLPVAETAVFPLDARVEGGAVVLEWDVVAGATDYVAYVNPDVENRPTWTVADGRMLIVPDDDRVHFIDEDPPPAYATRDTISYAVVAFDAQGEAIAQGRVAVESPAETIEEAAVGNFENFWAAVVVGLVALVVIFALLVFASRRGRR